MNSYEKEVRAIYVKTSKGIRPWLINPVLRGLATGHESVLGSDSVSAVNSEPEGA